MRHDIAVHSKFELSAIYRMTAEKFADTYYCNLTNLRLINVTDRLQEILDTK